MIQLPHAVLLCSNKVKLVILDECDAMTRDAQFALRRGEPGTTQHSTVLNMAASCLFVLL